jgi:BASS family bile acid:Na+ symporter
MEAGFAREVLLPIAIFMIVFGIGMELGIEDFTRVLRDRRTLAVGMVIQSLVFPLVALPLVAVLDLPPHLAAGFVLMAACPSGGFSNIITHIAAANVALSITMTTFSTLLAVFTMPAILYLSRGGEVLMVPMSVLAGQLFFAVLMPIGAGIAFRRARPQVVERYGKTYLRYSNIYVYTVVGWMFYQGGLAPFAGFVQAFQISLVLFAASALPAFLLAKSAHANVDDAFTIAIEASIRNMALATLIALSGLGRLDLLAAPTAYFFACALFGLVVAVIYKPYRARFRTQ